MEENGSPKQYIVVAYRNIRNVECASRFLPAEGND